MEYFVGNILCQAFFRSDNYSKWKVQPDRGAVYLVGDNPTQLLVESDVTTVTVKILGTFLFNTP